MYSIGTKGYIGTGNDNSANSNSSDFWEYDPSNNQWTQKANVPGSERRSARGFSIGGVGFVFSGFDGTSFFTDLWEYNPTGNAWTQRANFQGAGRYATAAFSIGGYGYVGTGGTPGSTNDFWEYHSLYVGIDEAINKTSIAVFPNPSISFVNIQFSNQIHNAELNIYDSNGRKARAIQNITGDGIIIDRGDLLGGIYFIDVKQDGKTIATNRIVITY